jgi:indolepyruvate ferredoxin oxidoreductase alpha subunit
MKINSYEAFKIALEDSGCNFITGYAGTIASSFLINLENVTQSINETVALDLVHMHSYLGKRAVSIVKNAGLNEACLPFRNMCDIGVNAGILVIITDDIEAKMSENKQDSRVYSSLGRTLLLEPSSPKELYEMVIRGFTVSEKIQMPVLIRLTNSLCDEELQDEFDRERIQTNINRANFNQTQWVLNPLHTQQTVMLHSKRYEQIEQYVELSDFNFVIENNTDDTGCLFSQALSSDERNITKKYGKVLSIGTYPLPKKKIIDFFRDRKVDIIDSGEGFLENEIRRITSEVSKGMTIERDFSWKGLSITKDSQWIDYTDLFNLISKRKPDVTVGDFGSYTMAFDSPIEYALHYGGAIASAVGAVLAGEKKVYAVVGDGGLSCGTEGLIEASRKKANINIIVIKNKGISKKEPLNIDLIKLSEGNGAIYCKEVKADQLKLADFEELESKNGPSVLIVDYSDSYKSPSEYILSKVINRFNNFFN